ncbi:MAG TPA: FAD/NAD(P)-binding oxidoreductase [Quisquiliibacterium sp.]|nr:FAD/NAD(P)-binding oxidoreductase [Quisquiliibacterium sp.]
MIDRRGALKTLAALGAASATAGCAVGGGTRSAASELMPGTARRVVIAGGGWGGITAARYLRRLAPDLEVVVLERNPVFFSCPMSNKWLVDVIETNFLMHDQLRPAARAGYRFVNTEITAIDRERKRVHVTGGYVRYDWLVLSPGIRHAYDAWFGNDVAAANYTRTNFPSAYIPNAEHLALKQKIQNFKGGDLVMTLPPPPHRCPPSPYERACLIAWHMKKHRIPGRIVILDPKDGIRPIGGGFKRAFEELYKDQITYVPNAKVSEVDPFNRKIRTSAGEFRFADAILMAPHQAGELCWDAGLVRKNADGKPVNGWSDVDEFLLHARDDRSVFVIGDAVGPVSPLFGHYPKAGHVANWHGRMVANYIAAFSKGREPEPMLPDNLCYMLVNGDPREAIMVDFKYKFTQDLIEQTQVDVNERSTKLFAEDIDWATRTYRDIFGT